MGVERCNGKCKYIDVEYEEGGIANNRVKSYPYCSYRKATLTVPIETLVISLETARI